MYCVCKYADLGRILEVRVLQLGSLSLKKHRLVVAHNVNALCVMYACFVYNVYVTIYIYIYIYIYI